MFGFSPRVTLGLFVVVFLVCVIVGIFVYKQKSSTTKDGDDKKSTSSMFDSFGSNKKTATTEKKGNNENALGVTDKP